MNPSRPVSRKPDWAWLPENILFLILTQLFLLSDVVSFGRVCANWRTVFRHRFQELNILPNMHFSRSLPMLLVPTIGNTENVRNLYSLSDGQVYDLRLHMPNNTRCIGSSHGWLIFIEPVSFVVTLFNPFCLGNRRGTITLPSFSAATDFFQSKNIFDFFPEYYICKAVLSADPISSYFYTVMMIYGEHRSLAYYNSGDKSWSYIDETHLIYDVIYSSGRFTAVDFRGELFVSDPESDFPELESTSEPLDISPVRDFDRRYIVLGNDKITIFQVVRSIQSCSSSNGDVFYRTVGFWVYKLGRVHEMFDWLELSSIGDGALFVGDSYSYYVKASSFPGIVRNSIYFTDDYQGFSAVNCKPYQLKGPTDAGVFLIGTASFHDHYNPDDMKKCNVPPIWITPTI